MKQSPRNILPTTQESPSAAAGNSYIYLNDLFSDADDGLILLKLLDKISPGIVVWKRLVIPEYFPVTTVRQYLLPYFVCMYVCVCMCVYVCRVNSNPSSRFKKVENANYVVQLSKTMKFSLVGVGGVDIVDCNKKTILAIISQLMRKFVQLNYISTCICTYIHTVRTDIDPELLYILSITQFCYPITYLQINAKNIIYEVVLCLLYFHVLQILSASARRTCCI